MPGTGKTACVHAVIKKLKIESQNTSSNNNNNDDSNTGKSLINAGKSNSKKSKSKKNFI